MNLDQIPQELRARDQWVIWKLESRDGKLTKVPYNARTGKKAKSNDPKTWSSFAAAKEGLETFPECNGVGYMFSKEDPFVGIDLDHCLDADGNLSDDARVIVDSLPTYWELSHSGLGVHGIVRAQLPPSGRKSGWIEMYAERRLFVTTGERFDGSPRTVHDCSAEVVRLHARVFPAKPDRSKNGRRPPPSLNLDDEALLDRARKATNGAKFQRLFDSGDTSDYGGDESRADLALCDLLAFWWQRDESAIDRLFRQSRLMRDKWDRPDYRAGTIALAVAGCDQVYTPAADRVPEHTDADDPEREAAAAAGDSAPAIEPTTLTGLLATFRQWLFLPDDGHIKVTLGAVAANEIESDPSWLMIVGASASGKTETVMALSPLPHVCMNSSLSGEAALLSATSKRDKAAAASGGLLRKIGSFGVLVLKDFTSILSMKHEQRGPLLAALREIYDGSWTRSVGTDGGMSLSWTGKLGMIAGCTPVIDSHHAVMSSMGERFIFYRIPIADADQQALRALRNVGHEVEMRAALAAAVQSLFAGIERPFPPVELRPLEEQRLVHLAVLAAACRSPVERDGRTRAVESIPDRESPGRLTQALRRLFAGMVIVGVDRDEAWRLLAKVATDSMPALRWAVFRRAAAQPAGVALPTGEFVTATRHPRVTVLRALEDLHAHDVLKLVPMGAGKSHTWELSDWARAKYAVLEPLFVPGSCLENEPYPKNPSTYTPANASANGNGSSSSSLSYTEHVLREFSDTPSVQARARACEAPDLGDAEPPRGEGDEEHRCTKCLEFFAAGQSEPLRAAAGLLTYVCEACRQKEG